MANLTYSVNDFVAFTKIKSAEINSKFQTIKDYVNTQLTGGNGTPNQVVITDGSGNQAMEAKLAKTRGGTGKDLVTEALELAELATPSTPASGFGRVYFKADGNLYQLNDAGLETSLISTSTNLSVVIKTSNYVASGAEDVILCDATSGAFAITLPAAASSAGKIFRIKKTDITAGAITITPDGSDMIDGDVITTLNTRFEQVELVGDGVSSWIINSRSYPSNWVKYTPVFTGFGSPTNVNVFSRRVGDGLQVRGSFASGISTAVVGQISLGYGGVEGSLVIDFTNKVQDTHLVGDTAKNTSDAGRVTLLAAGNDGFVITGYQSGSSAGMAAANGSSIISTGEVLAFRFEVPITGWN